jgi:hypothetical protein
VLRGSSWACRAGYPPPSSHLPTWNLMKKNILKG